MVQNAITLGPNCKKLEHDWAIVKQGETWGVRMKTPKISMHAYEEDFCNWDSRQKKKTEAISFFLFLSFLLQLPSHFQTLKSDLISYFKQKHDLGIQTSKIIKEIMQILKKNFMQKAWRSFW